jgi:hypothetical protein
MVFFTFPEDARWNAERDPAEGTSCVFCPPTRARGPCRGVSRGRAYRQRVRARRKAAVGIDATSSTAPAYRAPPDWDAPNALGPFPGECAQLRLPSF